MSSIIIDRVSSWNYVRGSLDYNPELEYAMLYEELEEYGVAREPVDQADALADIIFVAIGSLYKLTGKVQSVEDILNIVCNANDAKGTKKDKDGKITKPNNFKSPEPLIQEILDVK